MKKITFSLLLFLAIVSGTYAQVQVGEGTNQAQNVPFEPYYGYSYGQSIYLASEINASGSITGIKWYYSGSSALSNNQQLVVYLGHTEKGSFETNVDFVDFSELIQVYSGGITIPNPGQAEWVTITFTTPFEYDGVSNLVVAVDENQPDYNSFDDDFYNSEVAVNRSICVYSDSVNPNPANPANNQGSPNRSIAAFVPNIIFEGIQQACANPTALAIENLTISSAQLKWAVNPEITLYNVQYGEQGFELGSGIASVTGVSNPYPVSGLDSQTTYQFYVQADCGSVTSSWVGPFTFSTPCEAIDDFTENFDSIATGSILPECWSKVVVASNVYSYVNVVGYSSFSPSNNVEFYNSDDANAKLYLVSPNISSFDGMRVKFRSTGSSSGYAIEVGTMTNPGDPNTFTILGAPITLTEAYQEYNRVLTGAPGNFVAFRHGGGGTYRTLRVDDVILEPVPSVAPDCVNDVAIVTNETCGNFASAFAWSAVEGADGYRISIGTSSGADYVVDNVDLGNVTSYSFSGNPGTNYYYAVVAYNVAGSALGCLEDIFTTHSEGCFCASVPTSNDGLGITNVKLGTSEFSVDDVTYFDFSELETVELTQGINNNVLITFETGYTYDTHIWIDFNDNYTFEPSEKVYTGVSSSDSPTVLNATFLMPATATLGEHRMRIGSADSGQYVPNPCYSGSYGVTLDFNVDILPVPDCLPPSSGTASTITVNSALLNWVSTDALFNIEYATAGTPLGEGTLASGLTENSYPLASLDSQTDYRFYVQTDCGAGGLSPWAGPFLFRTACEAFGDFQENFETDINISAPECWSTIVTTFSQYPYIRIYSYNDYVEMYNSEDASATLLLVTPNLTDLPAGTHRIKFKARSYSTTSLIVGTMSDPANASTFVPVSTINLTSSGLFAEYTVPFTATANNYIAFKHGGGGTYMSIYIDDVIWEPIPTVLPNCVEDFNITINEDCGNFASLFQWSAVENADGYRVTIGTTPGGNDVVNNQDIGNIIAANFTGVYNTTYYYTITPYNLLGNAVDCAEGTFATASTGCYCSSVPTSNDGDGITNVIIGDDEFSIPDVTYADKTGEATVALAKDAETNLIITFATGYTYDANIWIDFNDNYTFEASERVHSAESTSAIPTDLDASFTLPASATLGVHRMRIGTADSGQYTPNPCYSGSYGVTLDFTVEVFDTLSNAQFDNGSFKVYPNPVKDILNLSYSQNITNVGIFNMLGQQVITKSVNATQDQIDMSDLSSGTYLVKVTAGSEVKTLKVVKQ